MNHYIFAGLKDQKRFLLKNIPDILATTDSISDYVRDLCGRMKTPYEQVIGKSREFRYSQPRNICWYHIKRRWGDKVTLKMIGEVFSNRHHSSILSGIKTFNDLIKTDRQVNYFYELSEGGNAKKPENIKHRRNSKPVPEVRKPYKPIPELIGNKYLTNL